VTEAYLSRGSWGGFHEFLEIFKVAFRGDGVAAEPDQGGKIKCNNPGFCAAFTLAFLN
jgi:hypothetical protein